MFKKLLRLGIMVVLAVVVTAGAGWSEVPTYINIQGKITDNTTQKAPPEGTAFVMFIITDNAGKSVAAYSGGTLKNFPPGYMYYDANTGVFSVRISANQADGTSAFADTSAYKVDVYVGGTAAANLVGSQIFTAVPYAITAKNVYGGTGYFAGNVGIGKVPTSTPLDVNGAITSTSLTVGPVTAGDITAASLGVGPITAKRISAVDTTGWTSAAGWQNPIKASVGDYQAATADNPIPAIYGIGSDAAHGQVAGRFDGDIQMRGTLRPVGAGSFSINANNGTITAGTITAGTITAGQYLLSDGTALGGTSPGTLKTLILNNELGEKITLWGDGTSSYGLAMAPAELRIHSYGPGDSVVFGNNSGNNTFKEAMRVTGDGNVGIGTPDTEGNKLMVVDGNTSLRSLTLGYGSEGKAVITTDDVSKGIRFQIAGSDKMIVNNDGNIGIGTTSPRGILDVGVNSDIYLTGDTNNSGAQSLYLPGHIYMAPYNAGDVVYLQARRGDDSGSTALQLRTWNSGSLVNAMRIASDGNVGIGVTAPAYKLDVAGRGMFRCGTDLSPGFWLADANGAADVFTGLEGPNAKDSWGVWSASNWQLTVTNSGNVGVGTTTPFCPLEINQPIAHANAPTAPLASGTTDPTVSLRLHYYGIGFDFGVLDNGSSYIQNRLNTDLSKNYPLLLNPNGGNVGIGTTAPNAPLQFSNAVGAQPSNPYGTFYDNYNKYKMILFDGGTPASSYGLGIEANHMNFNSNSGYKFYQQGSASALAIIGLNGSRDTGFGGNVSASGSITGNAGISSGYEKMATRLIWYGDLPAGVDADTGFKVPDSAMITDITMTYYDKIWKAIYNVSHLGTGTVSARVIDQPGTSVHGHVYLNNGADWTVQSVACSVTWMMPATFFQNSRNGATSHH
jgi:hypothetical protein